MDLALTAIPAIIGWYYQLKSFVICNEIIHENVVILIGKWQGNSLRAEDKLRAAKAIVSAHQTRDFKLSLVSCVGAVTMNFSFQVLLKRNQRILSSFCLWTARYFAFVTFMGLDGFSEKIIHRGKFVKKLFDDISPAVKKVRYRFSRSELENLDQFLQYYKDPSNASAIAEDVTLPHDLPPNVIAEDVTPDLPPYVIARNIIRDLPTNVKAENLTHDLPPNVIAEDMACDLPEEQSLIGWLVVPPGTSDHENGLKAICIIRSIPQMIARPRTVCLTDIRPTEAREHRPDDAFVTITFQNRGICHVQVTLS